MVIHDLIENHVYVVTLMVMVLSEAYMDSYDENYWMADTMDNPDTLIGMVILEKLK